MSKPQEILKRYWNFDAFKRGQEEIINAVLNNEDALALLPTGGGKSICYQVPGIAREGLCLVISPLIALMEDQIRQLKARNIHATAINSGMSKRQIDIALDNAIYGQTKFLYVSPERLKTTLFRVRFAKMKVNLIAIDEAHCISEWGYDFRPGYLNIASLRELQPNVPFLALTATATPDVVEDIQEKLEFQNKNVIRQSFERKNLTYNTWLTNNKLNRIEAFLKTQSCSGIIYCSTRRKVKELYLILAKKGFSVDYYHAGLTIDDRRTRQQKWTTGAVNVMIATNAFGMGIDKPDVHFVIHHDSPLSLEAYFQEAGRAGRDGNEAVAHLFYETEDIHLLERTIAQKYPEIELIKQIYNALGNHFQLAIGSGKGETFPLHLPTFANKYNLNLVVVYNAIKFLELCEYVQLSDHYRQVSKLKLLGTASEIYNFQVKDATLNKIILFILRTEMGAFDEHVTINEPKIAQKTGVSIAQIKEKLSFLTKMEMADYIPQSDLPTITYITERLAENNLSVSPKFYHNRKLIAEKKLEAVIKFLTSKNCKNQILLNYFGEKNEHACGKCSSCQKQKTIKSKVLKTEIEKQIKVLSEQAPDITIIELIAALPEFNEQDIMNELRQLADQKRIVIHPLGKSFKPVFDYLVSGRK